MKVESSVRKHMHGTSIVDNVDVEVCKGVKTRMDRDECKEGSLEWHQ